MQSMSGRPNDFSKICEAFLGLDRWYWLSPTHPCLHINYLERLYTRVQVK